MRKAELKRDAAFLRDGVRVLAQALMAAEVAKHVGTERQERTPERRGERDGHRKRQWDTRVGGIPLRAPRVRDGNYLPALLESRRRAERAPAARTPVSG